jgi:apolipoprotein D and lipocalin family protein
MTRLPRQTTTPLRTVDHVDLERYLGKWYEIASYPQSFQEGCSETTAEYSLAKGGTIIVENRCRRRGKIDVAKGRARVVDKTSNAKLEVSFFRPVWGDYWIIDLGSDYEYAVVGHPSRDYLWILSRTPTVDPAAYSGILKRLVAQEYDPARLRSTMHGEDASTIQIASSNPLALESYDGFCRTLADAYDQIPMIQPEEVWRWELLAKHVRKFYKRISSKIDILFVDGQPYDDADQMRRSVKRTGQMLISSDFNEHPFFDPKTNLQFRAVHDYVVHIIPGDAGPDFSTKGEIKAYNLHRRLAPPDTWPALFTEVAAQACYVNSRGTFPVQKVAVIPGFDYYNVGLSSKGLPMSEYASTPGTTKLAKATESSPNAIKKRLLNPHAHRIRKP